jgi:hypothetical protein
MKVLKIVHDSSPECPFDSMDLLYPCITDNKDYSKGDIDSYLQSYLTYNQMVRHQKKICELIGIDHSDMVSDYPESEYRMNSIIDDLNSFISYSMDNKESFCIEFGIKHYYSISRGYSQGDASHVFICWTPQFEKVTGLAYKDVTDSDMKHTFDMYGYWAWGDVFGFKVIEKTVCDKCNETHKEELDACWGFYGDDHFKNGIAEHVREHFEHLNDEEFKKMIKDVEVEYPRY